MTRADTMPPAKPRPTVVVFTRAPLAGATKTRLAAAIGDTAARRFHREMLDATLRRLSCPHWRTVLAVTPDRFATRGRFWPATVARAAQGPGDLGTRMARALAAARPDAPVGIVGSDIPGLQAGHLARAFAALATHDAVFGPASDGGYWLIALRDGRHARRLFRNVRWSSAHALADTRANLPARLRVALLDTLDDVDDGSAYARWRAAR